MSTRTLRSKRGRDDEPIEPAKRQKTIDEREIELMDINGLINIIGSNKQMNRVAGEVYNRKYGDKTVCLSMQEIPIDQSKLSKVPKKLNPVYKVVVNFRDDTGDTSTYLPVDASGPTDAEQFIRIFGHLVSQLDIDYSGNEKTGDTRRWKAIERLVMEHCGDSLTQLSIGFNGGDAFNKLRRPFTKLENIWFENCILTSKMAMTTSYFPNVNQLIIDRRGFGELGHFLDNSSVSSRTIEMAKKIGTFILPGCENLVNKLKNLVNEYGVQKYSIVEFLQTANKNMPQLMHLELYDVDLGAPAGTNVVHFENVEDLVIRLRESAPLQKIPLSSASLRDLELFDLTSSKAAVLSFMTEAKYLSKLDFNFAGNYGNIDAELKDISDKLKSLEEAIITEYDGTFSIEALKEFILNCTALRMLRIRFYYGIIDRQKEVEEGISKSLTNWKVTKRTQRMKKYGFRTDLIIERITF